MTPNLNSPAQMHNKTRQVLVYLAETPLPPPDYTVEMYRAHWDPP